MASPISNHEWKDFIEVATSVIETHVEDMFLESVALGLDVDVFKKYEVVRIQFIYFFTVLSHNIVM